MINEIWTAILEFIAGIIIPVWNDLISYLPLLSIVGVLAVVGLLARMWRNNRSNNRSRVPTPLPAGRQPEDLHLPGPSLWPFVAPVGLFFVAFSVALGPLGSPLTVALLILGASIVVFGIVGWYLDAGKEYAAVEAGGHAPGQATNGAPGWSLAPPEGMHLPGPSAWPLLAPVGLLFVVAGLVFGPAMLVGGLIMAAVAAIGWLFDAGRELDDVERHGHPTQADRDPEKAWPDRLIRVYFIVGAVAIGLTLLPWLLSLLPGSGSGA